MLMLLAFLVDQTQQRCCALFQAVWAKLGSQRLLWERMRALLYDYALASMRQLFEALLDGFKKSRPLIGLDASSSLSNFSVLSCHHPKRDPLMGAMAPPGRAEAGFNKTTGHRKSTKSLHKTAMPGRNPYRAVRDHRRIRFTSHQRESLRPLHRRLSGRCLAGRSDCRGTQAAHRADGPTGRLAERRRQRAAQSG